MLSERESVSLLEADPDLGVDLDPDSFEDAKRALAVSVGTIEPGSWEPLKDLPDAEGHLGLLVVDGLMARDTVVTDTTCAELVGGGDILRPWEHFGEQAPMPFEVQWHVIDATRIAMLDGRTAELMCRWPKLMGAVIARTIARNHALAFSLAITCMTGVKIRLMVLFWHLADRWGRVRGDGVFVPLELTHEMLGKLVGARRPSVSTALGELGDAGLIERRPDGWLLHGDPPEEVRRMHDRRRSTGQASR